MENKNIRLKVLNIVLSILVVILSGYLVYDKFLSKEDDKCVDNIISNEDTNDDYKNEQENIGFINPSEHVEIEEEIKSKLIEVFKFVYNYNKSKFYGNYCVGGTDNNDIINPPSDVDSMHKYNIASTEFSSFEEMIDY